MSFLRHKQIYQSDVLVKSRSEAFSWLSVSAERRGHFGSHEGGHGAAGRWRRVCCESCSGHCPVLLRNPQRRGGAEDIGMRDRVYSSRLMQEKPKRGQEAVCHLKRFRK